MADTGIYFRGIKPFNGCAIVKIDNGKYFAIKGHVRFESNDLSRLKADIDQWNKKEKEFFDYIESEPFETDRNMVEFYLRCRDADMHFADADRYAILNTLFGYDIGMDNAREMDHYICEDGGEIYELSYKDKDYLEEMAEKAGITLDFSKFRDSDFEKYEFFVA